MSDYDGFDADDEEYPPLDEFFEDPVLNYWTYYELIRQDDELYVVETIITQHEDQVAAQSDSEVYYHLVEELDDEEIVAELMELGFGLEEGEAINVRDLILSVDYVEDVGDDFEDDLEDDEEDDNGGGYYLDDDDDELDDSADYDLPDLLD